MNIILKRILTFFPAAVLMSGCIQEVLPNNGVLTSDQLEDYPLSMLVNGIPVDMMAAETAGYFSAYGDQTDFGIPAIHLRTEYMLEDIVSMGEPNYNQFNFYVADLYMSSDYQYCSYFWDCYYTWIKDANEIISRIDPDTEDSRELDWMGQAYAYRAMFYLDLARLYIPKENDEIQIYGDIMGLTVPIVTEATTEEQGQNNPRVPWETMYDFILGDLKVAEECLKNTGATSYTRPTLASVYGLYARAYLEIAANYSELSGKTAESRNAYKEAAKYAQLAITTSGKTPLTQAQWEDPVTGFNSGKSNNSWIWGLTLEISSTTNVSNFVTYMAPEATWGYGCRVLPGISNVLYGKISDSDFRKHSWLDPEWTGWGGLGSYEYDYRFNGTEEDIKNFLSYAKSYTNIKFRPASGEISNYAVGSCGDYPLMRVEEMYFIMMEATVKYAGNVNGGIDELGLDNAVNQLVDFMNRYRYTDNSYQCTVVTSSQFIDEMLLQKRIEFWGEGVLMYDYKRLDKGITRSTITNFDDRFKFDVTGRSPQWNIVIPRGEIQGNAGIGEYLNNPDPSAFYYN